MIEAQRLAIVRNRDQSIFGKKIRQRNIRRKPVIVAVREHERRFRARTTRARHNLTSRNAFPHVPQPAPASDAVKIRENAHARQLHELAPVPFHRLAHHSINPEFPTGRDRCGAARRHPEPAISLCATDPAESAADDTYRG